MLSVSLSIIYDEFGYTYCKIQIHLIINLYNIVYKLFINIFLNKLKLKYLQNLQIESLHFL